jgi:hypothetical protein
MAEVHLLHPTHTAWGFPDIESLSLAREGDVREYKARDISQY